jgi:hypothetical protein
MEEAYARMARAGASHLLKLADSASLDKTQAFRPQPCPHFFF